MAKFEAGQFVEVREDGYQGYAYGDVIKIVEVRSADKGRQEVRGLPLGVEKDDEDKYGWIHSDDVARAKSSADLFAASKEALLESVKELDRKIAFVNEQNLFQFDENKYTAWVALNVLDDATASKADKVNELAKLIRD